MSRVLSKVLTLVVIMGTCQCAPSQYRLVDHKRYHSDGLYDHYTYMYDDNGQLSYSTYTDYYRRGDSTRVKVVFSRYDTIRTEHGVDSVETMYGTFLPGNDYDTSRQVTSFYPNGVKKRKVYYDYDNGVWKIGNYTSYDSLGRVREQTYYFNSDADRSFFSYDSLGRYTGKRSCWHPVKHIYIDTIIYNGLHVTEISKSGISEDSLEEKYVRRKEYVFNKHGKMKQEQIGGLFEADSVSDSYNIIKFRYDWKGQLKKKITYRCFKDETKSRTKYSEKDYKEWYRYRRGLMTAKYYSSHYSNEYYIQLLGKRIYFHITSKYWTHYKYDFKHRLLLLKEDESGSKETWSYELIKQ